MSIIYIDINMLVFMNYVSFNYFKIMLKYHILLKSENIHFSQLT
jgi:hypothetical protein